MNALLDGLALGPMHGPEAPTLSSLVMPYFYGFLLTLIRLSGLMTVGPIFGESLVPANLRILLIVALSLIITPTVYDHGRNMFRKLDANRDGVLSPHEVPEGLAARYETLRKTAGKTGDAGLRADEFQINVVPPPSLLDLVWIGAGEFSLGFVLGLGVLTILSGMQLAGDLIDQQTGLSLGEIANPGLDITGSVTGQFLFMFATTLLLIMHPIGYHLKMVSALVETFQTIPLGEAFVTISAIDLLRDLVHQSLVLGIQIAAPLLAAMSLVALAMGFLGHSVPQINLLVVGFPVRALVSLTVLIASLSGIARYVTDFVPTVIDALRQVVAGV